jgi:uncharacterized protein (DUF305 family)
MRQWVRDWETADATLSAGPAVDSWQRSPTGPPSTSSAAATPTASEPAPTPGVATSAQLAALARAGGAELDRLFLELLVLHHQRSVELSTRHRVAGADSEVARLTGEILDTHRTRLDAARSLLGTV